MKMKKNENKKPSLKQRVYHTLTRNLMFAIGLDLIIIPSLIAITKPQYLDLMCLVIGIGTALIGNTIFEE